MLREEHQRGKGALRTHGTSLPSSPAPPHSCSSHQGIPSRRDSGLSPLKLFLGTRDISGEGEGWGQWLSSSSVSCGEGVPKNSGCFEDRHFSPLVPFLVSSALQLRPCASPGRAGTGPALIFHTVLLYFPGGRCWATVLISRLSSREGFASPSFPAQGTVPTPPLPA